MEREIIYLILHFLNFLAVKHINVFIAANVVALHLIIILIFVTCLKKRHWNTCIYSNHETIISSVWVKGNTLTHYSYISELFKYGVHLKLGCVTVVDAETPGFLIVGLIHFLQRRYKTRNEQKHHKQNTHEHKQHISMSANYARGQRKWHIHAFWFSTTNMTNPLGGASCHTL